MTDQPQSTDDFPGNDSPANDRFDEKAIRRVRDLIAATPDTVGPYRLLERIGGGGMGEVYHAQQRSPIRREVAIKFIKLGMDTKLVIARFEAERQALALMDHPHIAKVFDAGCDDSGRPYFVMEYVKGKAITEYADQHRLTIESRLTLFEQVCQATQHAHHKGVIHRDIKPSNVLVSTQDGQPFAKVIDFGIAKATAQRLTDKTLYTHYDQLIGTPQYMSPEQAEGSVDIDTRTDVYSLGVLLYELLTGSTPFTDADMRAAALEQLKKMIIEVDPPKPSTRISSLAASVQQANVEQSNVEQLSQLFRAPKHKPFDARNKHLLIRWLRFCLRLGKNWEGLGNNWDNCSTLGAGGEGRTSMLETLAKSRSLAPETYVRRLQGELDWIVMKSMDKDRARRYDTPSEFADDIQAFLAGNPVIAAPPSRIYQLRKLARRHRGPVIAAGAIGGALTIGIAGTTWSYLRAERSATEALAERDKADQARVQAEAARDSTELEAYIAHLGLAQSSMDNNNYYEARQHLAACPQSKRGWEWKFLNKRALTIVAKYDVESFDHDDLHGFLPNGSSYWLVSNRRRLQFFDPRGKLIKDVHTLSDPNDEFHQIHLSPDASALLFIGLTNRRNDFDSRRDDEYWAERFDIENGTPTKRVAIPNLFNDGREITFSRDLSVIRAKQDDESTQLYLATTSTGIVDVVHASQMEFLEHPSAHKTKDDLELRRTDHGVELLDSRSNEVLAEIVGDFTHYNYAFREFDATKPIVIWKYNEKFDKCVYWDITGKIAGQSYLVDGDLYRNYQSDSNNRIYLEYSARRLNASIWDSDDMITGTVYTGILNNDNSMYQGRNCSVNSTGTLFFFEEADASGGMVVDPSTASAEIETIPHPDLIDIEFEYACQPEATDGNSLVQGRMPSVYSSDQNRTPVPSQPEATDLKLDGASIDAMITSPDGSRRVVAMTDRTLRFYETASSRQVALFRVDRPVRKLTYSPDGNRLLLKLDDGTGEIWNTASREELNRKWTARFKEEPAAQATLDAWTAADC